MDLGEQLLRLLLLTAPLRHQAVARRRARQPVPQGRESPESPQGVASRRGSKAVSEKASFPWRPPLLCIRLAPHHSPTHDGKTHAERLRNYGGTLRTWVPATSGQRAVGREGIAPEPANSLGPTKKPKSWQS